MHHENWTLEAHDEVEEVLTLRDFLSRKVSAADAHTADAQYDKLISDSREELLSLALSDKGLDVNDKAFFLLCKPSKTIARILTHDNLFGLYASAIMTDPRCTPVIVGRIASILKYILLTRGHETERMVALLSRLLTFVNNTSVVDMFCDILSPAKPKITDALENSSFPSLLLRAIATCEDDFKLAELLLVLQNALKCVGLSDCFANRKTVQLLMNLTTKDDVFVKGRLWAAMFELCSDDTAKLMQEPVNYAISAIAAPYSTLHMFHTYMVDFLARAILYCPKLFKSHLDILSQVLCRLILQFPNATNLQAAIFRVITSCYPTPKYIQVVLGALIPVIVYLARSEQRTAAAAFSTYLITEIGLKRRKDSNIRAVVAKSADYYHCYSSFIEPFLDLVTAPYGGNSDFAVKQVKA